MKKWNPRYLFEIQTDPMMDKQSKKLKGRLIKNHAVEKWLQDSPNRDKGEGKSGKQSKEAADNAPGRMSGVSKDDIARLNTLSAERLELYGLPVYGKGTQSSETDTDTEQGSVENALPRVYVFKKNTKAHKHVQFDNHVTRADDNGELQRSMTNFLSRKECQRMEKMSIRSDRYIVSPSDVDFQNDALSQNEVKDAIFLEDSYNPKPMVGVRFHRYSLIHSEIVPKTEVLLTEVRNVGEDFSNHVVVNGNKTSTLPSYASRPTTAFHDDIPSTLCCNNSSNQQTKRSERRPIAKNKSRVEKTRLFSSKGVGFVDTQAPIIRGLVVDTVENQKPSIVRASKNANIREEFALKQKVESYRNACQNNISTINHAQRKLGANLMSLKNRLKVYAVKSASHCSAKTSRHVRDGRPLTAGYGGQSELRKRSESTDLFLQSKGYVPETNTPSKAYSFPALIYPKRRSLTIKQGV